LSLRSSLTAALFASSLAGQPARPSLRVEPSLADSLIAQGRLDEAENALYAASARAPRDPAARGALGAFLASRGRLKVGAVLLEEARRFGADPRTVNDRLAHVYAWAGLWDEAAAMDGAAALAGPEKSRARWLATHAPTRGGPDTSAVPLEPNDVFGLGRIALGVGSTPVRADIDPEVEGLVLPATIEITGQLQLFGTRNDTTFGVALSVAIGPYTLTNVPVRLVAEARARVGLDVLAPLVPTFNVAARRLELVPAPQGPGPQNRGALRAADPGPGADNQIPFLLGFPGVRIVPRRGSAPVALDAAAGRAALRGVRWTFDLRHGALVVR
jgi:hypothetical protein